MMWLLLILLSFLFGPIHSQPNECAVSTTGCTCKGADIICSDRRLTSVPHFRITFEPYSNIYLNRNRISTIRKTDFANLFTTNEVYISLENNELTTLEQGAFTELGNVSLSLNFNNVRLGSNFGQALQGVNVIELQMNRVASLDGSTLFALSESLIKFSLGFESLTTWPVQLKVLRHLENFTIINENSVSIPDNAFHGMENSLLHLTFRDTKLLRFPDAVCSLHRIETLAMSDHVISAQHSLVPNCHQPMTVLQNLKLQNVGLTMFPSVFDTFPRLTYLELSNNPNLLYLQEDASPNGTFVRTFNLSGNGLKQIPSAVRSMQQLQDLDLSFNDISTIENNDLEELPPISSLRLRGNPLVYISDHAFEPLQSLEYVDLRNTSLSQIPKAITRLSASVIDLSNNKLDCSCDLLWIRSWGGLESVSILGTCEFSKETLDSFIHGELAGCETQN